MLRSPHPWSSARMITTLGDDDAKVNKIDSWEKIKVNVAKEKRYIVSDIEFAFMNEIRITF